MALLARILLAILIAPWVVLVATTRLLLAIVGIPWRVRAGMTVALRCPMGHANPVQGRWTCGCGATYLGHAFAPCPVCGLPAGWMRCEKCGLAIRSPWKHG